MQTAGKFKHDSFQQNEDSQTAKKLEKANIIQLRWGKNNMTVIFLSVMVLIQHIFLINIYSSSALSQALHHGESLRCKN